MPYCPHCGREAAENTAFCAHCGKSLNPQQEIPPEPGRKRMHCPRCKSRFISPNIVSAGSIGAAHGVSQKTAIGVSTSLNETFWICHDCGHQFRSPDDLLEFVDKGYKLINWGMGGFCAFFIFILFLGGCVNGDWGVSLPPILVLAAIWKGTCLLTKKFSEKERAEIEELRKACFD